MLSLSAVVLLAALVFLLLRFAGLRVWHAVACILLGFFLASSPLAPTSATRPRPPPGYSRIGPLTR